MKPTLPVAVTALALCLGLIWAGLLVRTHLAGTASVADRFETVLLDLRIALAGQKPPPKDVVIVAIDDETIDAVGPYPLPRDALAALVDRIREAGARALAVDILLFGASDETADGLLANSLASLPTVVAGAARMREGTAPASGVPVVETMLSPAPALAAATSTGLVNIVTDSGGTPRHVPMLFLTDSGLLPSFSLQAAAKYLSTSPNITEAGVTLGGRAVELDSGWHLALNYVGSGGSIRTLSAGDLLNPPAGFSAELEGRMAVLGVTATAVGDRFSTPFDPVMPGVEVQATAIANLLEAAPLVRTAGVRKLDSAAALLITLGAMIAVILLPLAPASIFYLMLLSGWLIICVVFFGQGLWLNATLPFAASLPPVVGLLITRQVTDRIEARRLLRAQEALSRFQSPRLAERISEDPSFLATPKEETAAILFVDLSGYTSLSERLGAARTRDFLKEFHTIVVNVVSDEHGIVLDFMGDGAMLGFGIPEAHPDDPVRACRCAFALERDVTAWLKKTGRDRDISSVRVGAHLGQVVLSRLGHDRQQQIAATGDCVNVASRLLEVAKDQKVSVVLSADLLAEVEKIAGSLETLRMETVAIRGRQQELKVGLWASGEAPALG
ncbi:CHASE2 domain-containing protein [Roseibium sp.]|uniref:CHASE2 domain-containing protein n=1 Tax=Roseibium sp. TaxID=1936156 RepID=UPI003BB119A8